jgi:hypothetical protein
MKKVQKDWKKPSVERLMPRNRKLIWPLNRKGLDSTNFMAQFFYYQTTFWKYTVNPEIF